MENVSIVIVDKNFNVQNLQGLVIRSEKYANKIKIQFPKTYEGEDLTGKIFILKCTNANGVYFETLLPKTITAEYIELLWTVTAEFTTVSGVLKIAIFAESANYSLGTTMSKVIVEESPQYSIPIDDFTVLESYMVEIRVAADKVERDRAEALESKNVAVSAKNEAVTAKDLAVPASVTAVDAKNIAVTARDEAEAAKDIAVPAGVAAEAARDAAALSQADAITSKNAAAASQTVAETARTGAEAAKTEALASKLAAETAKTAAEAARDAAAIAQADALASKDAAAESQSAAETAKTGAEAAKDIAVTAADDAVTRMAAYEGGAIAVQVETNTLAIRQKLDKAPFNELFINADARNSIYRGKYLGSSYTLAQQQAVSSGTFDDMYIGDYWTIGGVNYRIAAFNYYRNTGDVNLTQKHVTIVPDTQLYAYAMNDTNITTGGYTGSKMYTAGLEQAKATINAAFPGKVLTHRQILCNATVDGKASGWAYFDSSVELMNEVMIYGCSIWGDSNLGGSGGGYNIGIGKSQLPLFALNPKMINTRQTFWLRDVVSAAYFAYVYSGGNADKLGASGALGVRPAFSIS